MIMYSWTANQQGQNMLQLQFSVMCPFSVHAISGPPSSVSGGIIAPRLAGCKPRDPGVRLGGTVEPLLERVRVESVSSGPEAFQS